MLAFAALTACGGAPATPRNPVARPAASALRVGTSGDYAPFSERAAGGVLAGFDVEVARAYAADRGRALELVAFRWPELATRLAAGDFDVVMSGVTVRPDRLVAGLMTATVADAEAVLVVADARNTRGGPHSEHAGAAPFDRLRRTIAVNRGGHLEQVAHARFPHARLVTVDDNTSLPGLLEGGDADAIVTDSLELAAFAARSPRLGLRIAARLGRDRKAYWLPAGSSALAADLDAWLLERERSGWLPALRGRLLGSESSGALAPVEASVVERVRRRLSLMPAVAAAKRAAALPVEDRARERAVERAAVARATAAGLDPESFVALTRAQIAAAKVIQRAAGGAPQAPLALADLRTAIDALDARIALELAAVAPLGAPIAVIADALVADDVPGLSPALRRSIAGALRRVRPAAGRRPVASPRSATFAGRRAASEVVYAHATSAGDRMGGGGCGERESAW